MTPTEPLSSVPLEGAPRGLSRFAGTLWPLVLGGLITLAAIMAIGIARTGRPPPLPVLGAIPTFELKNQFDKAVTNRDLRGKVWIADFIFLGCSQSCPKLTGRMAALQQKLENVKKHDTPIKLASFSVDPDNDTPDKLQAYGKQWKANHEVWSFLTGKSADLDRMVVEGFKMQYGKVDESAGVFAIMHGDWFVLIDADEKIRGYYDSSEPQVLEQLVVHANHLASHGGR